MRFIILLCAAVAIVSCQQLVRYQFCPLKLRLDRQQAANCRLYSMWSRKGSIGYSHPCSIRPKARIQLKCPTKLESKFNEYSVVSRII